MGGRSFFSFLPCSHHVPYVFPWGSSSSQVVPQNIPNNIRLISHMVCPKFNSHEYKVKRWAIGSTCVSILQLAVQRGASIGECPMSPKNIGDGPINKPP
jgi:hypothetical protein